MADLLSAWCEIGNSPGSWWDATPGEYRAAMEGAQRRLDAAQNARLVAAFWAARWGREKTMTPLKDVLIGGRGKDRRADATTPEAQIAAMDAWVIATGGELGGGKPKRRRRKPK